MPIIITLLIAIFFVVVSWAWHNLGEIEPPKKVATIIALFLIIYLITMIVFSISASGVNYENKDIEQNVKNVLVIVFTIINGLLIIPPFTKTFGKIKDETIQIDAAKKRFIVLIVVSVLILLIESGYLKDIQNGILDIFHGAIKK